MARLPVYRALPDPWRGWIGFRRARRYAQALIFEASHNARQGSNAPVINFYPMRPGPNSSMAYVLARMNVRIGHRPHPDQLTLAWDTGTWFSKRAERQLPANALNRRCLDISKSRVDALWARAAGYSIAVDPLLTEGPIVVKPDLNGKHGGRVVEGPIRRRQRGVVYQRLIDGRPAIGSDERILQMRVVIIGGRIIFTYAKWRPYPKYFTGTEVTIPSRTDDFLSPAEQGVLLSFAGLIGLEYGEMDTLRDRISGRIYVIDANRTPVLPRMLAPELHDAAFDPQAEALTALLR